MYHESNAPYPNPQIRIPNEFLLALGIILKQVLPDASNQRKQVLVDSRDLYLQLQTFEYLVLLLFVLLKVFGEWLPPEIFKLISNNKTNAMKCLQRDLGIFHGCLIGEFFNKWIAIARYPVRHSKEYESKRVTQGKKKTLGDVSQEYDKKGGKMKIF